MSSESKQDEQAMLQQVEDLRERMKLLQGDRRANVEIIQANKDANKDEISRLRGENKELRGKIGTAKKSSGSGDSEADIANLRITAMRSRKDFDTLRLSANKNKSELQGLKDDVKQIELEAKRPNQEDSPLTRNIRMLENRLDKAMIKYNEAQSIRKTYEQIVKRLKEERIGFDAQLNALERTMGAKTRDYEELILLSGDANHARDVAKGELERVKAAYDQDKRRRETDLRDRHQELALRRQNQDLMKQRAERAEEIKREEEAKASGSGVGHEGKEALQSAATLNSMTAQRIAQERREHKAKIDIFENAFRKIKDATGVSDVNEVIQKIVSQEGTTENLMLLTRENQAKIVELVSGRDQARARVDELKYAGPGGGGRRKLVDDLEERFAQATSRLEREKGKQSQILGLLIAIKSGVKHLDEKVGPARQDLGLGVPAAVANAVDGELSDEGVVVALEATARVLVRLLQKIKAAQVEAEAERQRLIDEGIAPAHHPGHLSAILHSAKGGASHLHYAADLGGGTLGSSSAGMQLGGLMSGLPEEGESDFQLDDDALLAARPHNQRVDLPSLEDGEFGATQGGFGGRAAQDEAKGGDGYDDDAAGGG
eukprot:CAMPEP_0172582806 /NCGR_PEP_ID=MMETSP1068-20121228/2344_1 /TAXON_ID=35684 /ORGANISM="Pseudopedinella elastica, Strain CCMP716" /LENGTH=602 /DNA_ID=CAMNT_0013376351 /DNA_START=41 /DNA_END=1846 /DNA_ORIENTATION=-